jgi:multidrug efflux pump subunit AcrA (membrane-fusion protein)
MQEMTLQVGQRVKSGDVLAKVAQPWKLMARLQIAETQAKDILLGQKASIDTRNGIVPGHVSRIDASIVNGTRTVDCKLDGPLPSGAVPDLSVDGTVEIERLPDVIYVGRPVFGQPNSSVSLFKLDPDGKGATRTIVRLGRASVNSIEILDGLRPGDQVILSDMSNQDERPRIRLN